MRLLAIALLFLLFSCQNEPETNAPETATETNLARVPDAWIGERVAAVKKDFHESGDEAKQLVWRAMEAHGGLERFYQNGPLEFEFNYAPLDGGTGRHTTQQVDTWRNRARHQDAANPTQEYGWTGETAWTTDTAAFAYNLRFWALTPYYFLGQPFVFAGEGVQLEHLGTKPYDEIDYDAVKVSFAEGTGDAPDDYYIAYFHPETGRQEVIRYIVSYPGYFAKGKHLPEKFMSLHDFTTVNGITFPTRYRTHWLGEDEQPGEHITDITVSDIRFAPELEQMHFEQPAGTMVLEGL